MRSGSLVPWTGITIAFGFAVFVVGAYARHRIYLAVHHTYLYRARPDDGTFEKYAELVAQGIAPAWPQRLSKILWLGLVVVIAAVLFMR